MNSSYCVNGIGSVGAPPQYMHCGSCGVCSPNWAAPSTLLSDSFACSGHGTCGTGGMCSCAPGWEGPTCNTTSSCASAGGRAGLLGDCCLGAMDGNGTCCAVGAVLNIHGVCCATPYLTPCGECSASPSVGIVLDAFGGCCSGVLDANGLCCTHPSALDACGVCDGVGGCAMRFLVMVDGPFSFQVSSRTYSFSPALYSSSVFVCRTCPLMISSRAGWLKLWMFLQREFPLTLRMLLHSQLGSSPASHHFQRAVVKTC